MAPPTFGRIDVHAHLLPGVDDGCATVADSILCAQALVAGGYTHAFCTSHVWPNLPKNTPDNLRRWTADLQGELNRTSVPLTLVPGGELNLASMGELPRERVVTYGLHGRFVLFDFWAEELPKKLEPAVRRLHGMGFETILAHPERIAAFQHDPAAIERVLEWGVRLQMNTWCLTSGDGSPVRRTAEQLLLANRYFLFGTDTHTPGGMPTRINGLARAVELVGALKVDELTRTNPRLLLEPVAS